MKRVKVAIAGATGYGGVELVRTLSAHPGVELAYLSSESYAGKDISEVYPHLPPGLPTLQALDPQAAAQAGEVVFLGLPHGKAVEHAPRLLAAGCRVFDLSGDFRLKDAAAYPQWYGWEHQAPKLLAEAAYGLPELHRDDIRTARLVACAGCYCTGSLLVLAPALRAGLISPEGIILDAKSGVSGAGRTSLKLDFHYPEANEDLCAYKVAGHQHTPEIEQEASLLAGSPVRLTFTPHLAPMTRGILVTAYGRLTREVDTAGALEVYRDFYRGEQFVRVLTDTLPHTRSVAGSNYAHISVRVDRRTGTLVMLGAVCNLGKGQALQAVQCLNLALGLPEETAIAQPAYYP